MKTSFVHFLPVLLLPPLLGFGQPSLNTDYFKSSGTGSWNSSTSWQSSHDNITYFPATLAPSSLAAAISIQSLHIVTINSTGVSLINTIIQSGGTLEITSPATYSIDGAGDNLTVENGGLLLLNFTTVSALSGTGTALIKTGGKVKANAVGSAAGADAIGDNYLNVNSKFTYQDKSIFEWNIAPYIFNSTGLKDYFKTASGTDIPILRISTAPVAAFGTSSANVLNCILEVNATFNIAGSGTKTFRGGLTGTSTINHTAGKISLPNANSVIDGSLTINTVSSGLQLVNGAIVPVGANVKITVPLENQSISKQGGNLQINGTLDITNCRIDNTGAGASVTIANGAILKTNNTGGFSGGGAAIVSEPIILETNSTIEFNRAGDQNFNSRSDFKNLTFSGSGIKKPASGFDPVGTVKITGTAVLDCTGHNLGDGTTNANLTMDGGRLIVSTGSTQPGMGGVYNITGGVVEFAGSSAKSIRSETYQQIEVTGSNVGNSNSNIVLRDQGSFTIKTGGIFTINDNGITGPTGTQTITVETGASFNCGNNEGFNGFTATFSNNSSIHSTIENINLNTGSNVIYMRNGDQPITNNNGLIYQHLTIAGTSGNKTAPSGTLTIQGNFLKSGAANFAHNNGTVIFNNSIAGQDYACTSTVPVSFYNITNANIFTGLNVLNNMAIVNTLSLADNSKLNLTNGDITLLSTATNTARVTEIPSTATITYGAVAGRFTVERYFPNNNPLSHRAWRLVTAPLNETGTIFDTWQLGGAAYGAGNYHTGTLITGPQIAGNGLDFTPTNNYSLKKYDGINFVSVDNTHVTLSPAIGTGYLLFVRGDRNPILTNIANNDFTTLSSRGKLQTGQVYIDASNNYSLVGNPYASPVDFNLIDKSNNINPHRFYIFDPNINQVGAYVTMEDYASPGTFIPTSPYLFSSQNNFIQSSQSFFVVKAAAGAASITFQETNKASNYNPAIFRPQSGQGAGEAYIRANLYLLNGDSTRTIADGNMAEFDNAYNNAVDITDAVKFNNVNENFSLLRNNQPLAVERRSEIAITDTLFYQFTKGSKRKYQFELATNITPAAMIGLLEDSYTKNSTPVNLVGTTLVNFEVNADAASAVPNRFMLTFKNTGSPLPIGFTYIRAIRKNSAISVEWSVEDESSIQYYEIEKSVDGIFFKTIQTIKVIGGQVKNAYKWLDVTTMQTDNFYRIKSVANNSAIVYSQVIKISLAESISNIEIYPNPATDGNFGVRFVNQAKGIYKIRLLNSAGQVIKNNTINHPGGSMTTTLNKHKDTLSPGMYQVQVIIPNKPTASFNILINKK